MATYEQIKKHIAETEVQFSGFQIDGALLEDRNNYLQIVPLDDVYYCVNEFTALEILKKSRIDKKRYANDRYDCDDYAFALKGEIGRRYSLNSVGLIIDYSGHHAYNCMIVSDFGKPKVIYIEPQTDEVVIRQDGTPYEMEFGFVII